MHDVLLFNRGRITQLTEGNSLGSRPLGLSDVRSVVRKLLKRSALLVPPIRKVYQQREAARAELVACKNQMQEALGKIAEAETRAAALAAAREEPAIRQQIQTTCWQDTAHLEARSIFIVGHARSGTTILLEALNDNPSVYLFGEANLHQNGLKPQFANWYNRMHFEFCNAPSKSTYCAALAGPEANGVDCIIALGQHFRFVGEKVAFRDVSLGYDPEGFFHFHARHFLFSHYICVVRNPFSVIRSNLLMFPGAEPRIYARSYLATMLLIINMYRTFPKVNVCVHEHISDLTFRRLGEQVGLYLDSSAAYYVKSKQSRQKSEENDFPDVNMLTLNNFYERFCGVFSPESLRANSNIRLMELQEDLCSAQKSI